MNRSGHIPVHPDLKAISSGRKAFPWKSVAYPRNGVSKPIGDFTNCPRAAERYANSRMVVDIRSDNEQFNLAYLSPGRGELRPVAANSFLTVNLSQRFRQGIGRGDSYVRFNPCSFPAIV